MIPTDKGILRFIYNFGIKTNKGLPYTFKTHPFLYQPLIDDSEKIVFKKSTQMGISLMVLNKIYYWATIKQPKSTTLYVLPSQPLAQDFVRTKVDPVILNSELKKLILENKSVSNRKDYSLHLLRLKDSFIIFQGSFSAGQAQSFDIETLCLDELDFQNLRFKEMFEERLSGLSQIGAKKRRIYISVPVLPKGGISEEFEDSNQQEWLVKCPFCNKEQSLEFPQNIDFDKKKLICSSCHNPLKKETILKGRWVARFPDRPVSGYHFTHLMCVWIPVSKIIERFQKNPEHTSSFELGTLYQKKTETINPERFIFGNYLEISDPLKLRETPRDYPLVCGIDQGDLFYLGYGILFPDKIEIKGFLKFSNPFELENFLKIAKFNYILMDMLPAKHVAKALKSSLSSEDTSFWVANITQSSIPRLEYFDVFSKEERLRLERTEAVDKMLTKLKQGKIIFPQDMRLEKEVFQHLTSLYPVYRESYGGVRKYWARKGKNDFAFALTFLSTLQDFLLPYLPKEGKEEEKKKKGLSSEFERVLNSKDFMTREIELENLKKISKDLYGDTFFIGSI